MATKAATQRFRKSNTPPADLATVAGVMFDDTKKAEAGKVAVYVLLDEHDEPRYVGISVNPLERLLGHIHAYGESYKDRWVRKHRSGGNALVMEVVEWVAPDGEDEAERAWIKGLRDAGFKLANTTDGGRHAHLFGAYPNIGRMMSWTARMRHHFEVATKRGPEALSDLDARLANAFSPRRGKGRFQ